MSSEEICRRARLLVSLMDLANWEYKQKMHDLILVEYECELC